MRIGFDFDNTIVSYDALFHRVAVEERLIEEDFPINKLIIRDHLRRENKEDLWTAMQGKVYGARMNEAIIFPEVIESMRHLQKLGHKLAIISHKTQFPFLGPQYDLHIAASDWIRHVLHYKGEPLIDDKNIFFEKTKEAKLARIKDFGCDIFLDDLPEILLAKDFPETTSRILFDPENHHAESTWPNIKMISSWNHLEKLL